MKPGKHNPMRPTPPPRADVDALIALYTARRYAEAESRTRTLLGQYPDFGFGWQLLGGTLQMQGKDALSAFQKVTELLPDDAEAHYNLGVVLKSAGRLDEALASYRRAVAFKPDYAEAHGNLGNTLKDLGRLDDAVASYRRALKINPDSADAHNNLGTALKDLGTAHKNQAQLNDAVASYRKAVALKPDFALAYYNLGNARKELGRLDAAVTSYRRATELKPDFADAHNNLGTALKDLGQFDAALASYRRVLELKPGFAEAHNNLGVALKDLGQLEAALASYRKAVELKPNYAEAHNNLGTALQTLGQPEAALASYRGAVEIEPDFAEAHSNLGNVLKELGQPDAAVASCRRAIEIKPDFADAHNNLGIALKELGQLDAARASYRRALQIKPDFAEAHNNLGSVLKELGQMDAALASYRRAVELKPDYAEAHSNLGKILNELGQPDAALASYRRARELQPQVLQHAIYAHLLLPVIPETPASIAEWRTRYQNGIAALMNIPGTLDEPGDKLGSTSFYLAYHNANDRPLMEALCRLFRARVPDLAATAPHVPGWRPPSERGQRIRVGFLSEFLGDHTIGKLYQGFIRHLDRNRFEVVVIRGPKSRRDAFRQNLDAQADKVLTLPVGLKNQQQAVAAEQLDILFYPDIGMAPSTYFLAYARLAPVQAISWGHPNTTGLDTIDYFVSAAPIEPEDAEEHYTERLIRLNRMPCFYQPLIAPEQISTRASLGLPETGTLYGCPQTLFKFHPDFDSVLAAIAEGDPTGRIVLLEGKYPAWPDMLRARWAKSFPVLLERVLFLPRMPLERFMALMAQMDVLLDPIHFGSGNTLYEAMVYGTPIVTWPGKFMRGRIVAGAYRQMGIADAPIAEQVEDYATLTLALGRDTERREALRQASLAAAGRELFADMRAIHEFEDFLEAAVETAAKGEKLPVGWKPTKRKMQSS